MTSVVVGLPEREPVSERVAAEIRAVAARKRVTQVQLARELHLEQPAVSRRMTGKVPFDANELAIVAKVLGVTVGQLFGEPSSTGPQPPAVNGTEWAPRGSNPQPTDYKTAVSGVVVPLRRRPVRLDGAA